MTSSTSGLFFRQLFDKRSWTYTYILADEETREAVIIDPVIDQVERDLKIIEQCELKMLYAINTHVHADHITGSGSLKKRIPGLQSVLAKVSGGKANVYLTAGECVHFGRHTLEGRPTPGHTNGCMSFYLKNGGMIFTGDALFVRGCGRTDFQEGDAGHLYDSIWNEILSLPDSTLVYPGHDYVGMTVTSVREEKRYNPRVTKSKEGFKHIMENLNLPYPQQLAASLPANLACGLQEGLGIEEEKEKEGGK
jgi:sulfur dioxygenase